MDKQVNRKESSLQNVIDHFINLDRVKKKGFTIGKNEVEEYLKTRGYDIVQHHCQ